MRRKGSKGARINDPHHPMFSQGFFADDKACAAYRDLMCRVFGLEPSLLGCPRWVPFAFFDEAGHCVASLEAAILALVCDGVDTTATGIRLVATDPPWRGRGLFRALMERALAWSATVSSGPCLLYTEDFELYRRFGFVPVAQHAFVGTVGPAVCAAAVRRIDVAQPDDRMLVERLLARRAAVSRHCAVVEAPSLFMASVAGADDVTLSFDAANDLLVVHENDGDGVTLVDVVAATIPPLDVVLATVGATGRLLKTLFPPDRLGWSGRAVPEGTGLMARGILPAAMTRPFMLPPTTEF